MDKVVYSVTKLAKEPETYSGIGYLTEDCLLYARIGKNGKPIIQCLTNVVKQVHKLPKDDAYSGFAYEFVTYEVPVPAPGSGYEKVEIEMNYKVWYKKVE